MDRWANVRNLVSASGRGSPVSVRIVLHQTNNKIHNNHPFWDTNKMG